MAALRFARVTAVSSGRATVTLDGASVDVPIYGDIAVASNNTAWVLQEGRRLILVGYTS